MASTRRRWRVREVVQTSSMDCGPAALKCVLDGFGIEASYGRLREACQTSIDGTSIDTLEAVAQQLGLQAEQVLVPPDHLALHGSADLPAIVVVQHADLGAHFVVVWRRLGAWVEVMDPAAGRQWLRLKALRAKLYRHDAEVDAAEWSRWAASDENRGALSQRLGALGLGRADVELLARATAACPGWFAWAALDAAARLARSLVDAGGLRRGEDVRRLLQRCLQRCLADPAGARTVVPAASWSVQAVDVDATSALETTRLRLRGAVVLRLPGRDPHPVAPATLPAELAAALADRPQPVWRVLWTLAREDRHRATIMLALAAAATSGAVLLELLLLRGLFDVASWLNGNGQRLAAAAGLLSFLLLRPAWDAPALREAMRIGRQLELRLRAALLSRLPRLHDRYFQSRPISDMADRAHGMQLVRALPHTAVAVVQTVFDLSLTIAGLVWLEPTAAPWALALAAVAIAVPLLSMPFLAERDLRVRTHAAALAGFYLDALLGLLPVRAHHAERAVRREHEALLVEWSRALRGWIRGALTVEAVQGSLGLGLTLLFVTRHFHTHGMAAGSDLLLVFWTLKIPALGQRAANLAEVLPAQRNALLRLLEPLSTPAAAAPAAITPREVPAADEAFGFELSIRQGMVRAGGHDILGGIELQLARGEHVAVVGASGAGKSSLLGLLLGWHRLAAGTLHVDGRPLGADDGTIEALRPHIAWVDPAVHLWNRSLLDNLLYASENDGLERVGEAVGIARVREVAARLPQGLQTVLGEGGALLSGGEGQRVRLARALLQDRPRLVLLDEPFRGLDRPTRHALLQEARAWWHGSTLLCVTHDIGETLDFARVLVVQDGRIVEDGNPRQLATGASRYRQLLQAEAEARAHAWGREPWRRIELRDGRLLDVDAPRS